MVAWWDQNFDGKSCSIHLLVKPQDGFTRKLVRHSGSSGLRAWIDGPYGRPQSFSDYGNVMMFASGVGIAAQILRIRLYVLRQFDNQGASYGDQEQYGSHERIRKLYGKPDIQKLIETEINNKRGRLMITTATNGKLRDKIRNAVCEYMVEDVKLVHLDFQPREKRWWFSARPTEVKYQGVV
ncbi:MAG: hypothetical protein LQ337_003470 [Flavoplaca oasis]|nr:MAG: hypothetical protein LQ337_003470 [Flavoplaca oasis]